MTNDGNFDDNLEISQMSSEQKLEYLYSFSTGRDPKTGKFLKGRSGNLKGRPRCATTLNNFLNISFSRKAKVKIEGKMVKMTNLQLACDVIVQDALNKRDIKSIIQLLKVFGSKIDISSELPPPKVGPGKKDPYYDESVENIKRAIYSRLDAERDGKYDQQNDQNADDNIDKSD